MKGTGHRHRRTSEPKAQDGAQRWRVTSGEMSIVVTAKSPEDAAVLALKESPARTLGFVMQVRKVDADGKASRGRNSTWYTSSEGVCRRAGLWSE